ncbi:AAA domain-containing protein [Aureibacter tunicatorum]|uniref:Superfamily I DNA and/or RNA helicase n=1 Tax=Aureibacter tunicatorum TaxID=866807 RepID=A0AAE3XKF8_9BACT|nr:AAA domain-containing protein [Aureibacter tunicatorum]MDR6239451.1 superfamily I DNA and/or RNA helicase [Aureibacter tunicatorum]BDD04626.1 helicase [Aureibacter tunicatorum]
MTKAQEKLKQVKELLLIERKEERKYFKNKLLNTSLKDQVDEGICWYPVVLNKHFYGTAERLTIDIERTQGLDQKHSFQAGNSIYFFSNADGYEIGKDRVQGVVNYVKKDRMRITLQEDELPEWAQDGRLGVNLTFDEGTYKALEKAMDDVIEAKGDRLAELREVLVGEVAPSFNALEAFKHSGLNLSQEDALNYAASARDAAIIHGPPGTGKTTTVVRLIRHLLKTEKNVLVVAPSNAAVDLLTDKLTEQNVSVLRLGHPARVTDQTLKQTLDVKITNHQDYRSLKGIKKKAEELRKMAYKYKRKFGPEERMQRKTLLRDVDLLKAQAFQLEHYIINDIMEKTDVVTCTPFGTTHDLLKNVVFETLIIDEATQALEPACWLPMKRANRVILAGDHCQLPPTVKSYEAKELLNTLFEKIVGTKQVDKMLDTQYRMNEKIMNFSNRAFYNGNLKAHDSVAHHTLGEVEEVLEFVDTAGCGFGEGQNRETRSLFNKDEADLLIKRLKSLLEPYEEHEYTIGVISPYKAQVELLTEMIEEDEFFKSISHLVTVNTIDSFQGQERDIIAISLVRSNERNEIGFLADTRRMNVAMTRARKYLMMIGDSATLGHNDFYGNLLDYVDEQQAYKSAFEYLY